MENSNPNSSAYPEPFPCCIWDPICAKYKYIRASMKDVKRYERFFKRTPKLAQPKYRIPKYQPQPVTRYTRVIQLVRPYKISTRLEQLALVQLRKLLDVKREFSKRFNKTHRNTLNRAIRKTIFSLYGRLANVVPPKPPAKPYKWTDADWKYIRRRLKKLAAPKKLIPPEEIKRKRKPLEEFVRTKELAIPNRKKDPEERSWVFKPSMKLPPTKRIREMAVPHVHEDTHYKPAGQISKAALKCKPSERTVNLAVPRSQRKKDSDLKDNPFEISPNALKYKASARITELAEPRDFPQEPSPDEAYKISPNALKYKATPRIIELAKPKGS